MVRRPMSEHPDQQPSPTEAGDPDWFRPPTRRERWIAAGLFLGFGIFFVALFVALSGWWFRWVILGLSVVSVLYAVNHARRARHAG